MISTEPANPVHAELSWKMVKKGYRSATRRPRKINRSLNIFLQDNDKGFEEEPSVAESEEFGPAVLDHRSSEKIDHLPIKKRRSQQQSLPCGEARDLVDGLVSVETSMLTEKSYVNEKLPWFEDSYGIELLATAACNASINDEILNVKEVKVEKNVEAITHTNASISVTSLEETMAANASNTSISDEINNVKAVKVEEKSEVFPQSDSSINVASVEENIINCSRKQNPLLKDINSVAHDDSREQNNNKSDIICSQKQNSLCNDFNSLAHGDSRDLNNKSDIICSQKQNSLCNNFNSVAHDDSRDQNNSPAVSGNIHDKSDIEAGKGSSSGKNVRLHWDLNTFMDEWELPLEKMNTDSPRNGSVDVHSEGNLNGEIQKSDASALHAWEVLKCPSEVEASGCVMSISKCPDSCIGPRASSIPSESPCEETMHSPAIKIAAKVADDHFLGSDLQLGQTLAVENDQFGKQDGAIVDSTISEKSMCTKLMGKSTCTKLMGKSTCTKLMGKSLDVKGHCKSEKAGPFLEKGGELVEKLDIYVPLGVSSVMGPSSEVELKKLDHSGEAALDDFLDDGDISDYSPGGHYHFARINRIPKYQSGCESPVEDGELRESIAYSWQENDEERDCVDYDMNDRDASDDLAEKDTLGRNDFAKELKHSATTRKVSGWDQIPKKTIEANDGKFAEVGAFDSTQELDGKGSLEGKVGSRPTRGKFSTHLRRLSGSGAFDGKDTRDGQRSSGACFKDGQVYRLDKYLGRDKFLSRIHDGSQKNSQDGGVTHNWDSRNNYQKGYRRGGSNFRIKGSNIPDANDDDLALDNHRRSNGNYSRGGYRPFVRRSPDDAHNSPKRRNLSTRDDSHYRTSGGSGFYSRGFVKGNRAEFNDTPSSVWAPRDHSNRRKYSNSPIYNKENSFSHPSRKSPSRSRSRSPVPWHLQRERNGGRRQINRSPDFRSEGRMGRNRISCEYSKFSENDGYFNDRNSGPTRYKDRDSPGRFFGQQQRFGSNGTIGRMKTNDSWRAHNNNNNSCNYDGCDSEGTRYNNKHDVIRRVRHNETGGAGRQFRSNADDCVKSRCTHKEYTNNKNNSCIRSIEKSDSHHFKHDSEKIYTTSSKPSGIRDYEDEIPANRG